MDKAFLLTKLLQCSAPFKSFETESWDILFSQPCGERVEPMKNFLYILERPVLFSLPTLTIPVFPALGVV